MSEDQRYPDVFFQLASVGELKRTDEHFDLVCKVLRVCIWKQQVDEDTIQRLEREIASFHEREISFAERLNYQPVPPNGH